MENKTEHHTKVSYYGVLYYVFLFNIFEITFAAPSKYIWRLTVKKFKRLNMDYIINFVHNFTSSSSKSRTPGDSLVWQAIRSFTTNFIASRSEVTSSILTERPPWSCSTKRFCTLKIYTVI